MNIFKRKKKVDTVQFWKEKVEYFFSDKFENKIQYLLASQKNLIQNELSSLFREHIIAAHIELLEISIGRNGASNDQRFEILRIEEETIRKYGNENIVNLVSEYNKKFGSSMSDGVVPMAKFFTHSIKGKDNDKLERFIYEFFYVVIRDFFSELKTIKLN